MGEFAQNEALMIKCWTEIAATLRKVQSDVDALLMGNTSISKA